jgi:homoserine kinase
MGSSAAATVGGVLAANITIKKPLSREHLIRMALEVVVPECSLRTSESRAVLPQTINHSDAVFNLGRFLLVAEALRTKDYRLLS